MNSGQTAHTSTTGNDDTKPKGEFDTERITRSVTLSLKFDRRMTEIGSKFGFLSISEILRQSVIEFIAKLEKQLLGMEIWEMIGGPIMAQIRQTMDNRVANLEDNIANLKYDFDELVKENKMDDSTDDTDNSSF